MDKRAVDWMLLVGSLVLGLTTAVLQRSSGLEVVNTVQFAGAALAPPLVGLVIGGLRRLFGRTNIFKWTFGWSVVTVAIEVLQRISD